MNDIENKMCELCEHVIKDLEEMMDIHHDNRANNPELNGMDSGLTERGLQLALTSVKGVQNIYKD